MIDRQQATAGERSLHWLNDVSTHSSRLMLTITDVVSPAPQLQRIRNYDGTVAIEASKPKKGFTDSPRPVSGLLCVEQREGKTRHI